MLKFQIFDDHKIIFRLDKNFFQFKISSTYEISFYIEIQKLFEAQIHL